MNENIEIWKDIPGYEGFYQCSNLGRIKSFKRYKYGKIMKSNKYGRYLSIVLTKDFSEKTHTVHSLIGMAFLEKKPDLKLVIDHIDDNPLNNLASNLRYVTSRENISKSKSGKTSKYTGVYYIIKRKKYKAVIQINGKQKHLGFFNEEHEAHQAYQNKLKSI